MIRLGAVMLKLQQNLGACVMDDGCQSNRIVEQAGGQNGIFQLPQAGFVHDAVANDEESGTVAAGAFLIKCDEPRVQEVLLFKAGFDGSHDDPVFQEVRSHLQRQKQMRIGGHDASEASPNGGCRKAPARTARC